MNLLLWSVFGVFSQLAFVRTFTTLAGGTSYYSNLFLLIGVVSLGAGYFIRKISKYFWIVPYGILYSYFSAKWIGSHNLISTMHGEFLWSSVANLYPKHADFDLQLAILVLSVPIIPVMMLIGSQQAAYLLKFKDGFVGYVVIGLGGISGAVLFVSQNQFFPEFIWLIILWSIIASLPLFLSAKKLLIKIFCLVPLIILISYGSVTSVSHLWSPYQRIDIAKSDDPDTIAVLSNGFYISSISTKPIREIAIDKRVLQSAVFSAVKPEDNVLILGSCAGTNDVREALFAGAKHVTAVEIDSEFVRLGTVFDPDKTYYNNRVKTVIADARQYLNNDSKKYGVIYSAFLDSQTNASNKSRFRLDSFLYTREGIDLIVSHLEKDGVLFINFATANKWIRDRMFYLLKGAAGDKVKVFQRQNQIQTLYVVSNSRDIDFLTNYYEETTPQFNAMSPIRIPTDDWPFFYSFGNQIPMAHIRLLLIMLILMIAIISIAQNLAESEFFENDGCLNLSRLSIFRFLSYAFFSGAAFFFIELRAISALTPILGSTYMGQAYVVIGIIISSLLGSLLALIYSRVQFRWIWMLLFSSLALTFFSRQLFHPLSGAILPSSILYIGFFILPTFISGYLYLLYIKRLSTDMVLRMQKWNYIGGAIGGLCEVVVIITGFHKSLWFCVLLYFISWGIISLSNVGRFSLWRDSSLVVQKGGIP